MYAENQGAEFVLLKRKNTEKDSIVLRILTFLLRVIRKQMSNICHMC